LTLACRCGIEQKEGSTDERNRGHPRKLGAVRLAMAASAALTLMALPLAKGAVGI
jgi:hypothetical protein